VRIARVTVRLIEREMGGKVWNPRNRWTKKRILLAFVESACGKVGVGEAWMTGGSPGVIKATIEDDLAPLLVGEDPFRVRAIGERVFKSTENSNRGGTVACGWSAVETATVDLCAKLLGVPLHKLLGTAQERIFTYASAGLYGEGKGPVELAAEVKSWVDQGFTACKIKVGGAPLAEDVARVAAVREAIGAEPQLMVDALNNLDVAQAIAMARAFEPYGIAFFEAPVSPYDLDGQALVAARVAMPVCGNEQASWLPYFRDLVTKRAAHIVQFDVAACGGVLEGQRIGEFARAFHLPCTLHSASSAVLFAASLHLAAALPNAHSVEYHMLHQWLHELVPEGSFAHERGWVRPPPGPGIGIELTPDDV
jgi:L-alanine-DL-glutamate epimerase-like enolase superfamily enzyme